MKITIDPEFKALIPPLAPEEYAQLEVNILQDGCRDPLVIGDIARPDPDHIGINPPFIEEGSFLVDGHNRYEICTRHGIEFKTETRGFPDRTAAMLWMIDNQLGKRNVSIVSRVQLVEKGEHLIESRQGVNQYTKSASGQNCPDAPPPRPRDQLAEKAGVSSNTYRAAKLILDAEEKGEITPEVAQAVRQNKIAVHRVAKDIKENRQREGREKKRVEAVKEITIPENLIIGDFREHADQIPDGSVSLIFTDPPYDRKASEMLPELGEFAAAKLMEGGSLVLYVGQTQIPAALDALRPHLRYWWTIACVHAGRSTVMREYGLNAGWKAVLWFVKGTRHDNSVMVNDVMSGGEEKSHHDWQQSQSEAEYWIGKLTKADDFVCDPFMGGGTTAAASKVLGRKWIGFEIDETNGKIIAERLSK
jgi:16S rRNA G966 N2-methylase RsmD